MRKTDYEVIVIGAGVSGMTTALLLAKAGVKVALVEAHTMAGGCAGFFKRDSFSFDVGATTFISFQPGGIGHKLISTLGITHPPLRRIREYQLCLPDRTVRIPIDWDDWIEEWSTSFPEVCPNPQVFFSKFSIIAQDYWRIASRLPSAPLTSVRDVCRCLNSIPISCYKSMRWFNSTLDRLIHAHNVSVTPQLAGAMNMLLQDTTQNNLTQVPVPMGVLGLTLMPHGLYRPVGGAKAFWDFLLDNFISLGGTFKKKHKVAEINSRNGRFELRFKGGRVPISADKVVSSMPVWNTYEIAPHLFNGKMQNYLPRKEKLDSAFSLYLGMKDIFPDSVCQHYQVLSSLSSPLGDGNNFLISISDPDDLGYAPQGYRSVTISTHTDPHEWAALNEEERTQKGYKIVDSFLEGGEKIFPGFREAIVDKHFYPASPLTYQKFTQRYMGMAGNQALTLRNCNLNSIPTTFGDPNFQQIGETTFPGAGTVACMLSGFNAYRNCMNYWLRT
jgi:phytoene dehydrogenase-like protein